MVKKEKEIQKLPCDSNNADDYNCLNCSLFNDCQMKNIEELKSELKLDDDY